MSAFLGVKRASTNIAYWRYSRRGAMVGVKSVLEAKADVETFWNFVIRRIALPKPATLCDLQPTVPKKIRQFRNQSG
jgi:hypothetical protein